MSTSGSFNTNKVGEFYVTVSWNRTGYSATNNEHYINYSVVAHNTAGKYRTVYIKELTINGNKVYNAPSGTSYYNNNTITSGSITIPSSNSAGDGSITVSFRAGVGTSQSYNISGSGTWSLDRIPRYATVTQSLGSKTETEITINWKTDSTPDGVWYSLNGGSSWTGVYSSTATSGTYTLSNLSANTTYNIITRVKRKDSGLFSQTSSLAVQTYNYPYCTGTPNFTIGDKLTLPIYNPLGRSVKVYIISNSQTNGGDTITGTSISGYNNSSWQSWWYARIPSARSGTYQVKVQYGSIQKTTTSSGTYSINAGNCMPVINNVAYIDNNSSTVAITGSDSIIVQYFSNLYFNFNNLVAKNSATLSGISVSILGNKVSGSVSGSSGTVNYGHINQSGTLQAEIELTDSRMLKTTQTININVTEYIIPNAIISLSRKSNFYEESYIKVNADYSQIGSNAITIKYRMKQSGQDDSQYTSWTSLSDNVQATFNADNNVSWIIWVQIYDTFIQTIGDPSSGDNVINYYKTLPRGIPLTFYDEFNNSVGFNCFPDRQNAVLSTGLPLDDVVLIGSQIIVDSFTQSSNGTGVVAKCFNYDMIQNLFDGVYMPPSYERAYRLVVNVGSVGDNNYGYISLNNFQTRPVRTMYSAYWKSTKISSSRIFKESEITLQNVNILGQTTYKGLQLTATSNNGSCNFYDITIQGYLVKQSTNLSDVTPDVPTTLENTALLTLHRVVCDYMIANYGYANAQAVDNAFTFTYYGTNYQGVENTPIYQVELSQSSVVKYTFTCNVVSELAIDVVVS